MHMNTCWEGGREAGTDNSYIPHLVTYGIFVPEVNISEYGRHREQIQYSL